MCKVMRLAYALEPSRDPLSLMALGRALAAECVKIRR